jgi:hypothetical protein
MTTKTPKNNKCKYCHLIGHLIDKCPTIICKHCRSIGHPNWLCPGNPNAEKPIESPVSPINPISPGLRNKNGNIYGFESTNSLKGSGSSNRLNDQQTSPRKNSYGDFKNEFKTKNQLHQLSETGSRQQVERIERVERVQEEKLKEVINIKYYHKILNEKWGDII